MKIANTVGQLIEILYEYPREAPLAVDGPDTGGWDVTFCPTIAVFNSCEADFLEDQDRKQFGKLGVVFLGGKHLNDQDWWDLLSADEKEESQ